jgi:hypothetical protein
MNLVVTESQFKKILEEVSNDEISKLITDFINENFGEFESEYLNTFDEIILDVLVEYHVKKSSIWDANWGGEKYEGTVYIIIDRLLVGSKDQDTWERMYGYDDIPEFIWDELEDKLWNELKKYFDVNVDFDFEMNEGDNIDESILNESILPDGLFDLLFDVIEDYKDSCDFFEDELDFAEGIIDYTISRAVSQTIIEPTTEEYIDELHEIMLDRYGDTLMSEYNVLCKNED